jgi:hypothetical protein
MRLPLWFGVALVLVGCGGSGFVTPAPIATIAPQAIPPTPTPTSRIPFPATVTPALPTPAATPVPFVTPTALTGQPVVVTAVPTDVPPLPIATAATPRPATDTHVPVPTLTLAQAAGSYPSVDAADVAKRSDFYKDKKFRITGRISNVEEKNSITTFNIAADTAAGSTVTIAIGYPGTNTSIQEGVRLTAYCVGIGSISGPNAFGATITEAAARAD